MNCDHASVPQRVLLLNSAAHSSEAGTRHGCTGWGTQAMGDPGDALILLLPVQQLILIAQHLDGRQTADLIQAHPRHFAALRRAVYSVTLPPLNNTRAELAEPSDDEDGHIGTTQELRVTRLAERRLFPALKEVRFQRFGTQFCK